MCLERKEAVSLFEELGFMGLIRPFFVLIQLNGPNRYKLLIKGNDSNIEIEKYLENMGLEFEKHKNFLIIENRS
jgi:hypothetical protein